jgi:4-coumarate--CoA ligase
VLRAYIVTAPGIIRGQETEGKITRWLAERVVHHKRLRGGIQFVDEIPESAAGKIMRRVLQDQAKQEERKRMMKL